MADHFRILGIKALKPEFRDRVSHLEKVEFIQKALFEQNSWLYFYKGVVINQEEQTIWMSKETLADFSLFDIKGLKISVSAIVGKNGSGKSSIVDLMIRMINNLAAAVMGEGINYAARKSRFQASPNDRPAGISVKPIRWRKLIQKLLYDPDGFLLDFAAETVASARHHLEGGVLVSLVGLL